MLPNSAMQFRWNRSAVGSEKITLATRPSSRKNTVERFFQTIFSDDGIEPLTRRFVLCLRSLLKHPVAKNRLWLGQMLATLVVAYIVSIELAKTMN